MTFAIADRMGGQAVAVVGDFNDWDPAATPLRPNGDGARSATITMPAGGRYAFRYLAENGQWFNDDGADDYQGKEFGGQDGVVDLSLDL